ncbi:MAG: phosphotransferase enzyme family protein [Candidatus Aminicenantes bacterium]
MSNFDTRGNFASAHRYGSGHIHDTFLVHTTEESSLDYLLQRINHHVFRNVPQLMSNIERVTKHIQKKISQSRDSDFSLECLSFVPAKDGKYYYRDPRGNYWRVCVFIPESSSYDMVDSPDRAYAGGKAFGRFLALVADLSADSLYETIPDFLDMEKRLDKFYEVLKRDPVKRAKEVPDETSIVKTREEEMKCINRLGREGKIPKRVTHNDTKFNNILFDSHHNPLCVIDLDTVMPGYIHYDFGDAIRTVANTGAEDEENLEEVHMDMGLFEAFSEGFLQETKSFLVEAEIDYLAFSAKSLTFMAGLRFLTDFLDGDHYYKIDHEYHNLQRTRAQWKLLESMDEQYAEMQAVIKKIARS